MNSHMDDLELRLRLETLGEKNIGPLTDTTRPLFEKRLVKLLQQNRNEDMQNGSSMPDPKSPVQVSCENEGKVGKRDENCCRSGAGDFDIESVEVSNKKNSPTSKIVKSENNCVNTEEVLYYGVNIPVGSVCTGDEEISQVYTDKKEALRAMKKCKGARFKMFKTESEALEFANCQTEQLNSTRGSDVTSDIIAAANSVRPSSFRGPKSQDLVKLRKAIECGDIEYISETVWSNPRYLVSSGDTPTILQEGSRYNALHVAAKTKQFEACSFVLSIVESKKFMQALYNDDSEDTCNQRIHFLTDLYLNTPDKGLCETPLHFASKFGSAEIVNLLVSHPLCHLEARNKYGQTASEIVCCRCQNETPELKSRIEDCFQNRYYIPILRSDDNSQLPSVGVPWSPTFKKPLVPSGSNPLDTPLSVKAYAGPMSPKLAAEFHRRLSTPTKSKSSKSSCGSLLDKSLEIRLSDVDKGLERVGREIASDMKVSWAEYWPFLKSYCDLSKCDGLGKLEMHLKNKYNEVYPKVNIRNKMIETEAKERHDFFSDLIQRTSQQLHSSSDDISSLCEALRNLNLDSSINSSHNSPLPSNLSTGTPASKMSAKCICPRRTRCHSGPPAVSSPSPAQENNCRRNNFSVNINSFVERSCHVIGSQIFSETSRFVEALEEQYDFTPGFRSPQKAFGKSILPYVKCLFNIMSHLVTQQSSLATNEKEMKDVFSLVHFNVALHVNKLANVNEGNGVKEFFKVLNLPDIDLVMLSDLSDDEIEDDGGDRTRKKNVRKRKVLLPVLGDHLKCILQMLIRTANLSNFDVETTDVTHGNDCPCSWDVADQAEQEEESDDYQNTHKSKPIAVRGFGNVENEDGNLSKSVASDTSTEMFFTPEGSWHSSRCSSISEVWTPDEGLAVFIDGSYPSKIDIDVLRAIDNVAIDPVLYPHIHRWKYFISSYKREGKDSFLREQSFSRQENNYPLTSTPAGTAKRNIRVNPFANNNNGVEIGDLFED